MRLLSRIDGEVDALERRRFDFVYELVIKLRPSDFGQLSRIPRDRVAAEFFGLVMSEAAVAAGYALKEVVV